MPFNRNEVSELLAKCHRRCCVCHRFCGVKMETDHIIPISDGGNDNIENAIPLCFECHAEAHMYNDAHPRGRKYTPEELLKHKQQWLELCENSPQSVIETNRMADPGPLSSLLTELEFNKIANPENVIICPFETKQFDRAVAEGVLSILQDNLKSEIMKTYATIKDANYRMNLISGQQTGLHSTRAAEDKAEESIRKANMLISPTLENLRAFLTSD